MASDELKRRISLLHRGLVTKRRPRGMGARRPSVTSRLEEHLSGAGVCGTDRGSVLVCQVRLSDIYADADRLVQRYLDAFGWAARLVDDHALPRFLEPLARAHPDRAAFIDTETAGLHGRPLFMVGIARYGDDDVALTQYFARSYPEEAGLLHEFASVLGELDLLISFNGKAFDWPFMRDRMVYHRVACEHAFAHLDLLHPSRRRWRAHLPNCKLQTLERYLCGRWRSGDIPGDQIPQRYHDFVREGDPGLIAPVFHHNRLDLITMIELLSALVSGRPPTPSASPTAAGPAARAAAPPRSGGAKGAWDV
jgi:uncharacterized protein YprB with RNaseH-like and TPR domain